MWGATDRCIHPLTLTMASFKQPGYISEILKAIEYFGKRIIGKLLIRIVTTTLLQIFCKIILNSKVIIKSRIKPDNSFMRRILLQTSMDISEGSEDVSGGPEQTRVLLYGDRMPVL